MMRKTKIVATVGPACRNPEILKQMLSAGVDVLRINASHTSPKELGEWISKIRGVGKSVSRDPAILVDLQGPRVRTGKLKAGKPFHLKTSQTILIKTGRQAGGPGTGIFTPCRQFPRMVKQGDRILIDNGLIELETVRVETDRVKCRVLRGGILGENKGINLPNAPVTLPALAEQDLADLEVAGTLNVDYLALSFVRSEDDIDVLKRWLRQHRKDIPVIAKIEKPRALQHLEAIISLAEGLMVARGDLGIEMGVEKVPPIQKALIARANAAKVLVITATQMLESMMDHPTPTRAEVSDIANAVYDGTDAVMLSGETAIGKYPVEAVRMMAKIIAEVERHEVVPAVLTHHQPPENVPDSPIHAITQAAHEAAEALNAKALIVFTRSGKTALLVSKLRPQCPVLVFCQDLKILCRIHLFWGVQSFRSKNTASTEVLIDFMDRTLLRRKVLAKGDPVVIISGKQALRSAQYMIKIHVMGE